MTLELETKYTERARAELRKQRQRNIYFLNSHIFGDPAWELVLEAYIAASESRCVILSDLVSNLRRPVAIITRLALILESEGYVERCRSHDNGDLRCVQLTVDALSWCEQCLDLKSDDGEFQNN
jgi:DNA-binding MarR family transcriptional regulator